MSKYEENVIDFNEDIINKLYDSAIAIKNENHDNPNNKTLFSSVNQRMATVDAAMHIAYILTELKDKVLIVNLDAESIGSIEEYIHSNAKPNLFSTLKTSMFLSDAINQSKYEKLDIIHIEEMAEEEMMDKFSQYNILSKLSPLKNYYDHIFIIGPEFERMNNYGVFLELADSAVTVMSARKNDRYVLNQYLQKINLFNVKSFGILRKAD